MFKKIALLGSLALLSSASALAESEVNVGYVFQSAFDSDVSGIALGGKHVLGEHSSVDSQIFIGSDDYFTYEVGGRLKADLATELAIINTEGVSGYVGITLMGRNKDSGNDTGYKFKTGVEAEMFMPGVFVDTGIKYVNIESYNAVGLYAEAKFQINQQVHVGIVIDIEEEVGAGVKVGYTF